jgi:hypothetical protein
MSDLYPAPPFSFRQESLADLESALSFLKAEASIFAYRFINDSQVRQSYIRQAEFLAAAIRDEVELGRMTPSQAADMANRIRNSIMQASRIESSDVGRALAEAKKRSGKTLDYLENKYEELV